MAIDSGRIEAAVAEILAAIGEDTARPGLASTPKRVAEAYGEFFAGIGVDPTEHLRDSVASDGLGDLVLMRDIRFRSVCEHHLLPFTGVAHVAYLPGERIVGLGRLPLVVDTLASRPQLQERLGEQIADALVDGLAPRGVLVVLDAVHGCVSARGPRQADSSTVTVATRGALSDPVERAGVLALVGGSAVTVVMGILNVTPDSFSDGGQFADIDDAIARGLEMRAQGADLVDVGGESTRPGAERIPAAEELRRVLPVIRELAAAGVDVSIDTMNAETALAAADAGARVINDVSGGLSDPNMYSAVVDTGLTYIAMHWRGAGSDHLAEYGDVVADVRSELKARLAEMIVSGIDPARVVLDPGLGFAKNAEHNWQLLGRLDEIASLGHPLLIGASRKRFLAQFAPEGAAASARDEASALVAALAARAGVWGVRVHDVVRTRAALNVAQAWTNGARR